MSEQPSNKPSETTDELLEHEYDGIREYDNPLPKWWVWMFWGSFWFSCFYFFHYHMGAKGVSVAEAYVNELKEAREAEARLAMGDEVSESGLAQMMANTEMMADTQALYKARCEQCHADKGQGQIGANLTDEHWIHGEGKLMDIYKVVAEGVPAKGMPAWERQLTPIEMRKIVAFIGTLRGKNLPGKAPEGNKVDMAALLAPAASEAPATGGAEPAPAGSAPAGSAPTGSASAEPSVPASAEPAPSVEAP